MKICPSNEIEARSFLCPEVRRKLRVKHAMGAIYTQTHWPGRSTRVHPNGISLNHFCDKISTPTKLVSLCSPGCTPWGWMLYKQWIQQFTSTISPRDYNLSRTYSQAKTYGSLGENYNIHYDTQFGHKRNNVRLKAIHRYQTYCEFWQNNVRKIWKGSD